MQMMLRLLLYATAWASLHSGCEAALLRQGADARRQATGVSAQVRGLTHFGVGDPEDAEPREAPTREDILMGAQPAAAAEETPASGVEQQASIEAIPTGLAAQQVTELPPPSTPVRQATQLSAAQLQQWQEMQRQMQELQLRQQQLLQAPPRQLAAAQPQPERAQSLVATRAAVSTAAGQAPSMVGGGLAKPKGWDQCLHFARYVKEREVSGVELVKTWQATCQPAVRSGRASERYRMMCNSMAGAVEPFAAQADYNIEQLCDTVLALFHDLTAADAAAATR